MDQNQRSWPDDRPISGAAFARVDTTISCVLTRFHLRSSLSLIPFYLAFRRIRREAQAIAGLVHASFLVENRRTCYTLSLWKDDYSIVDFGGVRSHITAANSVFSGVYGPRPEIWSGQFRMWAVSCHNFNWEGVDWQTLLADQWAKREQVARNGFTSEQTV